MSTRWPPGSLPKHSPPRHSEFQLTIQTTIYVPGSIPWVWRQAGVGLVLQSLSGIAMVGLLHSHADLAGQRTLLIGPKKSGAVAAPSALHHATGGGRAELLCVGGRGKQPRHGGGNSFCTDSSSAAGPCVPPAQRDNHHPAERTRAPGSAGSPVRALKTAGTLAPPWLSKVPISSIVPATSPPGQEM